MTPEFKPIRPVNEENASLTPEEAMKIGYIMVNGELADDQLDNDVQLPEAA